MSDKQWLLSIERAQYEADRAERQFMLADPENRLVVRSLESNWNQKLKELEKTKQDYAIYRSKKAWIPSEKEEQDILDLAQKIPEIWNAPTSTPKEKELWKKSENRPLPIRMYSSLLWDKTTFTLF